MAGNIRPKKLKTLGMPRAFPRPAGTFVKSLRKSHRNERKKTRLSYVSNRLTDAAAMVSKMRRSQRKRSSSTSPSFRNTSGVEVDFVDDNDFGQAMNNLSKQFHQDFERPNRPNFFDSLEDHCHIPKQANDSRSFVGHSQPSPPESRKSNIYDESTSMCNCSPKKMRASDFNDSERQFFCPSRDPNSDVLTGDDQDCDDSLLDHTRLIISTAGMEDSDDAISIPSLPSEEELTVIAATNGFEVHGLIIAEALPHPKPQYFNKSAVAWSTLTAILGPLTSLSVHKDDSWNMSRRKAILEKLWINDDMSDGMKSLSSDESVYATSARDDVVDDCSIPDLPELLPEAVADSEVHFEIRSPQPTLIEADDDMFKIGIAAPLNRKGVESNEEKIVDFSSICALLSSLGPIMDCDNTHKCTSIKHLENLMLEIENDDGTYTDIVSLSLDSISEVESFADAIDLDVIHHNTKPEDFQREYDLHSIPSLSVASEQTSFDVTTERTSICNFFNPPKKTAKKGDLAGPLVLMTSSAVTAALLVSSNFCDSSSSDNLSVGGMGTILFPSYSEPEEDSALIVKGTTFNQELDLIDDGLRHGLGANNLSPSKPPTQSKIPGSEVRRSSLDGKATILSSSILSAKTRRTQSSCTQSQRNVWVGRMFGRKVSISLPSDGDSLDGSFHDDENEYVCSPNILVPAVSNCQKDSMQDVIASPESKSLANSLSKTSMENWKTEVVSNRENTIPFKCQSPDYYDVFLGTELHILTGQNEDSDDAVSIPSLSLGGQGGNTVKGVEVHNFVTNQNQLRSKPQNIFELAIAWSALAVMLGSCRTLSTLKVDNLSNQDSDALNSLLSEDSVSATSSREDFFESCSISDLPELSPGAYADGVASCGTQSLPPLTVANNHMHKVNILVTRGGAHQDSSIHRSTYANIDQMKRFSNDFDETFSLSSGLDSLDGSLDGVTMNHCEDASFIGDIYIHDIAAYVSAQSVDEIEDAISLPSLPEVGHNYMATAVDPDDFSRVKCEVDPSSEDFVESAIAWTALATLLGSPTTSSVLNIRAVKSPKTAVFQNLWRCDESESMVSLACDDDSSNESDTIVFMDDTAANEDDADTSILWWPMDDQFSKDYAITCVSASVDSIAALSALLNVSTTAIVCEGSANPTLQIPQTLWLDEVGSYSLVDTFDSVTDHLCRENVAAEDCCRGVRSADSQHEGDTDSELSCTITSQGHHVSCHPLSENDCRKESPLSQPKPSPRSDSLVGYVIFLTSMATLLVSCDPKRRRSKRDLDQNTVATFCGNVSSNGTATEIVLLPNDHFSNFLVQLESDESEQCSSTYSILPGLHRRREFYSDPKKMVMPSQSLSPPRSL